MEKEIWKEIENYDGYEVSTMGRIRSYWGRGKKPIKKKEYILMTPRPASNGYLRIQFRHDRKEQMIHRVVCKTFIENPNGLNEVDHIDRDKKNNRVDNLRWADRSSNNQNTPLQKSNTSGFKGVCFTKATGYWRARIYINKKEHSRTFKTKEEAIDYRNKMVETYYDKSFYTHE